MKINLSQNVQQQQCTPVNKKQEQVSFKGIQPVWNFLATNPVWGATAVDVCSMSGPRTIIDTKKRGKRAGAETGIREFSSTVNDACVGLYGLLAGTLLGKVFSKAFNFDSPQRIFASNDALDVHMANWKHNGADVDKYINDYIDNLHGFNPNKAGANAEGYVKIGDEFRQGIFDNMKELTKDNLSKKERKSLIKSLHSKILEATGSEEQIMIKHGTKSSVSSLSTTTDDFYRVTKVLKEKGDLTKLDKLGSSIKTFSKSRAGLGLLMAMGVSASIQPINVWLTKKKTGSDGFAGMPGREKDKSFGFKMKKVAAAGGMLGIFFGTIKTAKPSKILNKIMFKGTAPTIDQFKILYATTIVSRILSCRDKDELRESCTKDYLGYLNWLVIGNFVGKGVTMALQKKDNPLIRYNKANSQNGFLYKTFGEKVDRFFNSSVVTRKELVAEELVKNGKSILKPNGKAMKLGEMIKELPKNSAAKKSLGILTIAQIANYLYSGLVLGVGIPNLNIAITASKQKKRNAQKMNVVMSEQNQNFVKSKSEQNSLVSFKSNTIKA